VTATIELTGHDLTVDDVERVALGTTRAELGPRALEQIATSRALIDRAVAEGRPTYGVNTGFGRFVDVAIAPAQAAQLQLNLLRSHACGVGDPFPDEVVRAATLLRANALAKGTSGVRAEPVRLLVDMLAAGVCPVVPSRGSLGASGDLAPLAHLGLVLVGEGFARVGGETLPGADALARAGLEPIVLAAKEGLALINGTHLMAAAGGLAVRDARRLLDVAVVALALSLEAFKGSTVPFDERLAGVRPHPGAQRIAARLRALLDGSEVVASHADCGRVQDPYTLRCAPQVLGAVDDALTYVEAALERELDAVTDNPLVFPDDGDVVAGGNFHGQPLSLPLDHLALALCELASFSERRTYALLSPSYAGLPAFLSPRPGLSSGLMLTQYAAAALVNECQVLAHPAGAASIPTSAGQEDFNSMGALAALKARTVVENCAQVIATELACACQGLEFHRPLRTTPPLEAAVEKVRAIVPRVEEDRVLSGELGALADALRTGEVVL
jgi:histidine ammonia-lyase